MLLNAAYLSVDLFVYKPMSNLSLSLLIALNILNAVDIEAYIATGRKLYEIQGDTEIKDVYFSYPTRQEGNKA